MEDKRNDKLAEHRITRAPLNQQVYRPGLLRSDPLIDAHGNRVIRSNTVRTMRHPDSYSAIEWGYRAPIGRNLRHSDSKRIQNMRFYTKNAADILSIDHCELCRYNVRGFLVQRCMQCEHKNKL